MALIGDLYCPLTFQCRRIPTRVPWGHECPWQIGLVTSTLIWNCDKKKKENIFFNYQPSSSSMHVKNIQYELQYWHKFFSIWPPSVSPPKLIASELSMHEIYNFVQLVSTCEPPCESLWPHPLATPLCHTLCHTHWPHPFATPFGHTLWPHPLVTLFGHTLWSHPLVTPIGHTLWPHPLQVCTQVLVLQTLHQLKSTCKCIWPGLKK